MNSEKYGKKLDLIRYFLIEGYEMLHTQSKEYIADSVIEALQNWETYHKEKFALLIDYK